MRPLQSFAKKRLALYCTPAPTSTTVRGAMREYGDVCDQFSFTTLAPGGFGTMSFRIRVAEPRLPRPELALFARVFLISARTVCFVGEITDPKIGMDSQGDYINVSALGIGAALRDDPEVTSYTAQTPLQIIANQLTLRTTSTNKSLLNVLSTDTSAIFPDAPAATFSPSYDQRNFEEVLNDVTLLAGDYQWGVWADPSWQQQGGANVDANGFPLGRIEVHPRNTTSTDYTASLMARDIVAYEGGPSADRAYNSVEVGFLSSTGGYDKKTYTDSRLASDKTQGTADFRYRRLVRDQTGISTVNGTQAQAIANTQGALMQSPTNKWTFTLKAAHDGAGNPIALHELRADKNLFITDFAPRGASLALTPTAGVNQFYIVQTTYREDGSGIQVEAQCDNYADVSETRIARLQLQADIKARSGKQVGGSMVAVGSPISGVCSVGQSNALAGLQTWGSVAFAPQQLFQAPTSISFNTIASANATGVAATDLRAWGFSFAAQAVANGTMSARFTFTTSGNCIRAVRRSLFDWHCDGCGKEFRGLSVARDVRVVLPDDLPERLRYAPGHVALAIDCPECAQGDHPHTESFNTALRAEDEDVLRPGNHQHRAEQAQLIRKFMRHNAIGLEVLQ